jgi:hypothetical protein
LFDHPHPAAGGQSVSGSGESSKVALGRLLSRGLAGGDKNLTRPRPPHDAGFWLEQTLFQTLQTWRALEPQRRKLRFWRDRAGHEVDFILEQDHKLVALVIKTSRQVTSSDTSGIAALRDSLRQKATLVRSVVLRAGKARPLDVHDMALPWG